MLRRTIPLTLLCLLFFARADASPATDAKELRKAEAVVAKLRTLEEASAKGRESFRKAAEKIYPGLFSRVAELRDSGLKADLSTAAALYESVHRGRVPEARPDCSREMRSSYSRLCTESPDGPSFLFAKARMHTRFGEAVLAHAAGLRDEATLETVARLRAERAADAVIAEEGLRLLKGLAAEVSEGEKVEAGEGPLAHSAEGSAARLSERFDSTLARVGRVLASLPRGDAHLLLRNARDALRDGLFWELKALPGRALVVSVNSFGARDPLRQINLDEDSARRAARQNFGGALKFLARAEAVIGGADE